MQKLRFLAAAVYIGHFRSMEKSTLVAHFRRTIDPRRHAQYCQNRATCCLKL